MKSESKSYKEAGVDITAGYEGVKRIKKHIARTKTPNVLSGIGGFGGLFQLTVCCVLVQHISQHRLKRYSHFFVDRHNNKLLFRKTTKKRNHTLRPKDLITPL